MHPGGNGPPLHLSEDFHPKELQGQEIAPVGGRLDAAVFQLGHGGGALCVQQCFAMQSNPNRNCWQRSLVFPVATHTTY